MSVAAPPTNLILLHESAALAAPAARVDVATGVIRGVKILGRQSPNSNGTPGAQRTEYEPTALAAGRELYEGVSVFVDHLPRGQAGQVRSSRDEVGWLENVEVREDGLYGDLHLLNPDGDFEKRLLGAAVKRPQSFSLSHNARGAGPVVNGTLHIQEIRDVHSVDIVTRGGTTRSLFESEENKPIATPPAKKTVKVRALLESLKPKLSAPRQVWLARLLEDDGYGGPMGADMDAPTTDDTSTPTDPADALKSGFEAAIMAIVQDDTMDAAAKAKKIAELLKTHEKLTAEPEPEPPAEDVTATTEEADDSADDSTDDKDKKMQESLESLQAQVRTLTREKSLRQLAKTAGLDPDDEVLMESLSLTRDEAQAKRIVGKWKTLQESAAKPVSRTAPRSSPAGATPAPGNRLAELADSKAVAAFLTGRN